jgi:hypothetical protein
MRFMTDRELHRVWAKIDEWVTKIREYELLEPIKTMPDDERFKLDGPPEPKYLTERDTAFWI